MSRLMGPLGASDGDDMALGFADIFLNISIVTLIPGLMAITSLAALDLPEGAQAQGAPALTMQDTVLRYAADAGGALRLMDADAAALPGLGTLPPGARVIAAFPSGADYGAVNAVLRDLDARTDAPIEHVEYLE